MVEFNGMYFNVSELVRVEPIETGDLNYPKGIDLVFKTGYTYRVKCSNLATRDQEKNNLIRRIEIEERSYEEKIFNSFHRIETLVKRIEDRQLRLYRTLKGKLSSERLTE